MPEPDREVVDFIFEQGRSSTDRQLRDADALDQKATQIFTAATIVIGLAGLSHQANAPLLLACYWDEPVSNTKYAMVNDMAAGFAENERSLGHKRRGVLWARTLTGIETSLVGAAVIWSLLA